MQTETVLLILLAAIVAAALVFFQYRFKEKRQGRFFIILSVLRFLTWFGMLLLIINPEFKQTEYYLEKADLMVLIDNSSSIKPSDIYPSLNEIKSNENLAEKFDMRYHAFGSELESSDSLTFSGKNTNVSKALKSLKTIYGSDNGAVVLLTDGNQTLGEDYEFYAKKQAFPIFPLVVGDTTAHQDLKIDQVNTNRYAFLKNKFPIEVFISYQGVEAVTKLFTISINGRTIFRQPLHFNQLKRSEIVKTVLEANSVGIKNIVVRIEEVVNERNIKNNFRNVAVEVIDEKTNIAIVSDVLHPDIGALSKAIESNEQREVTIYNTTTIKANIDAVDLFVFYQPKVSFKEVYDHVKNKKASYFTVIGPKTDLRFLNRAQEVFFQEPITIGEETFPIPNASFSFFDISDFKILDFPPLDSNLGSTTFTIPSETILTKRIKGVDLNEPLLSVTEQEGQRQGTLFGENIWKWRVQSFRNEQSFKNFDDFIGQLVRFLTSNEAKSRFSVSYEPIFEGSSNAKIKATYFDKNYKFDQNAKLELQLKNVETAKESRFSMLLKSGYFESDLSNLVPGEYSFTATVSRENLSKSGRFTILDFDVEQQFLSSDYKKLQRLAASTDGKEYFADQAPSLVKDLLLDERFVPVQKSDQNVVPLIDFRLLLALIVLSLAFEWFIRKFNGLI